MGNLRTCCQPGCERRLLAKGFCSMHYTRDYMGKAMDAPRYWHPERLCSQPGCERKYLAKGFCQMHYRRDRRGRARKAVNRG